MFGFAAAFGGGIFARQQLSGVSLPQLRRPRETAASFKLSVRVVAASAPALAEPGFWSQQRPRLEVCLGDTQKDTELADFAGKDTTSPSVGACARECPWRFADTLTFAATVQDVQGPGLRLRLRAQSDLSLGPVQLQLVRAADLGEACVDLRRRVLPSCVRDHRTPAGVDLWESPVLLIPLMHVKGGVVGNKHDLGEAVAHIALSFSLNMNPEEILGVVEAERRPVSDVLASKCDRAYQWLDAPIDMPDVPASIISAAGYIPSSSISDIGGFPWMGRSAVSDVPEDDESNESSAIAGLDTHATLTPWEAEAATERAGARAAQLKQPRRALPDPELAPEGWITRKGPNGKIFWHHRSLGPAPWETDPAETAKPSLPLKAQGSEPVIPHPVVGQSQSGASAATRTVSFGPIMSPDLPAGGWVSHMSGDGRMFWHNTALGPPPWQQVPDKGRCAGMPKGPGGGA